jgi:hypothetical protein
MNILEAIDDPNLIGASIRDPYHGVRGVPC